MATLHIQLLGDFHLLYDNEPIKGVNTPRLQSLLAYLVLHRQAPSSRQYLAFVFWPDTSEVQALTNLRNLLHKLRQALPEQERFLQADALTVQWRPDAPFTLDVAAFETAAAQTALRTDLEKAVECYRGDLLPGCYDDWMQPERERLHQMAIDTLERLIKLLEETGEYRSALQHGQRLLQLDPLNEATYRNLMRLHVLNGDRPSALKQYEQCERVLRAELGVEPAPETVALAEWIKQTPTAKAPVTRTNLPSPVSSFIGRRHETVDVKSLLKMVGSQPLPTEDRTPSINSQFQPVRLVTLTGTGGSGKTRLAIHVATDLVTMYPDGVWWVELVSLLDSSLLSQVIAKTLGVSAPMTESLQTALSHFLQDKQLLLVLDNCEHLVDACAQLAYLLLHSCPKLQILATSREPLGITGEQVYPAPPLSLPDLHVPLLPETLLQYEAIRLFVERVQGIDASFRVTAANAPVIAQICHRLDGIPLAIELAAARARVLPVDQIAARLNDRLNLLTTGSRTASSRHQTLRATLDWSYALLTDEERLLFRRLAVFAGYFPFDAVEAVCGPLPLPTLDLLARLVDKSLVMVERTERGVYYRLLETICTYAGEKLLASGEIEQMHLNHLYFFIRLTEVTHEQLGDTERDHWLSGLEQLHDNIRIALRRSLESGKAVETLRLAAATGIFWELYGYWGEGRHWLTQASQLSKEVASRLDTTTNLRGWTARALMRAGALAWRQCDFANARTLLEQSLALYRNLNKQDDLGNTLSLLGGIAFEQGDYATAQVYYAEYLDVARGLGTQHPIGMALFCLGLVAYHLGEHIRAQRHLTESLTLLRTVEHSDVAYPLNALGTLAALQGDEATAWSWYHQCLALRRKIGDKRGVAAVLNDIANLTAKGGDYPAAHAYYTESLQLFQELGNRRGLVSVLSGLARLHQRQGDFLLAARLFGAVEALLNTLQTRLDAPEPSDRAQAVAVLHTQLDASSFYAAWEEGHSLTLEQAIHLAL